MSSQPPAPEIDDLSPDDALDILLRSPREAAERALVLSAVCRRAFLEERAREIEDDDREAERFDLVAWLRTEGLDGAATDDERRLLHARVGRLPPDDAAEASWRTEALVALAWALDLLPEMPPYDAVADPAAVVSAIPAPWSPTAAWRRDARLRPEATIATERERAELWHWRAETADLVVVADDAERSALATAIRDVAAEARNAGVLTRLIRDDFPARGEAYRALAAEAVAELGAVAVERVRALNWLCGFGSGWNDVPLAP